MFYRISFFAAIIIGFGACKATNNPPPEKPANSGTELTDLLDCPMTCQKVDENQKISKICFGSCSSQNKDQPILNLVAEQKPDLFIYLGDNIYGDTEDMSVLAKKYNKLCAKPEFQQLQKTCPIIATWDDHDYGANDSGREYPKKEESKEIFLKFWAEPEKSKRRKHKGIYTSYRFGQQSQDQIVQIILLDTRSFRTALLKAKSGEHKNDYRPNEDPEADMLGAEQWAWLGKELEKPANIRIIGSSNQFGIEYNGYEAWANFPKQREKMLRLIGEKKANGVMFISGDVHYAELSKQESEWAYPIYDCTSSGITQTWSHTEANKQRLGSPCQDNNFGTIEIDWEKPDVEVTFKITDINSEERIKQVLPLSEISF